MEKMTLDLFAALAGTPRLPGARCRGRSWLFDPARPGETQETVAARHRQALGLCGHCPALDRCIEWFEALPKSDRPRGVVGARINQSGKKGKNR